MKHFVSNNRSIAGQLILLILSLIFFSIFIYFDITEETQNAASGRAFILVILLGLNYFSSKWNVIYIERGHFFVNNFYRKNKIIPASEFDRVNVYFSPVGLFKIVFRNGEKFLFLPDLKTMFKGYFTTDFKNFSIDVSNEINELIKESHAENKKKILKFHSEEVILILLILSTDLSVYDQDDLVDFTEAIEGRIDILFDRDFLPKMSEYFNLTSGIIEDMEILKRKVVNLYTSQWRKKLKDNKVMKEIRSLSADILERMKIDYIEPYKYVDNHLEIDWY